MTSQDELTNQSEEPNLHIIKVEGSQVKLTHVTIKTVVQYHTTANPF